MSLTFSEFKDALALKVSEKKEGTFEYHIIQKSNGISYTGLAQRDLSENTSVSPVVNVNILYKEYRGGTSIETCVDHALTILNMEKPNISSSNVTDWNVAKEFLFPRLVSGKTPVDNLIHKDVVDLHIIFTIRINCFDNHSLTEAIVTKELAEDCWNKTVEELYEQAIKNLEADDVFSLNLGVFDVISNKYKVKGAVECLNPKVLDKYNNHYIIPSSTNEILFISKSLGFPIEYIKEMVTEVNRSSVSEEDKLSDNVYEYVNGKLTIAEG